MAEIIRRKGQRLPNPEYPPGNAFSVDVPRPQAGPRPSLGAPVLPRRQVGASGSFEAPPDISQSFNPIFPDITGIGNNAPTALPSNSLPLTVNPITLRSPTQPLPSASPGKPVVKAQRALSLPTQADKLPPVQGFLPGSKQSIAINKDIGSSAYIPPVGGGVISSSTGNTYRINPQPRSPAPEASYQPQTLGGLIAGLAVKRGQENANRQAQSLAIQDRQQRSDEAYKTGVLKNSQDALAQDNYIAINQDEIGLDGITPIKKTTLFNKKTGLPAPKAPSVTPEQYLAEKRKNPALKKYSDEDLLQRYREQYGQ
jgi:hypothetical protein